MIEIYHVPGTRGVRPIWTCDPTRTDRRERCESDAERAPHAPTSSAERWAWAHSCSWVAMDL